MREHQLTSFANEAAGLQYADLESKISGLSRASASVLVTNVFDASTGLSGDGKSAQN